MTPSFPLAGPLRRLFAARRTTAARAGNVGPIGADGDATPLPAAAEGLAARMPALIVAATHIAATVAAGAHGRRQAGPGDSFWQFRPAQPGEPVTRIDWRQSARSSRAYVRETEAEAAQTICLWCDPSASMRWRSNAALPPKLDRAALLALAAGALLLRQGERVRLLTPDGPVDIPPGGRTALDRLGLALLRTLENAPESPCWPHPQQVPRHARIVLIGDGLALPETIGTLLRDLAARPARAHLLLVNDPAEAALPYAGRIRFAGLEDEAPLLLSGTEGLRPAYAAAFADHQARIAALCRATGHDLIRHTTDRRPEHALLALHAALSDRPGGRA
ncbi:DUF58 domain-containing protein [Gluconacetobacter tumulisoli]